MKKLFVFLVFAATLAACGNKQNPHEMAEVKLNADSLKKVVADFDSKIKSGAAITQEDKRNTVQAYKYLSDLSADNKEKVDYLLKAGNLSGASHYNNEVKTCFEAALALETDPARLAEIHFTYAFINDTYLKQLDIAKMEYEKVVNDFPTSPWASEAKNALGYLGKSDEEILKEFEKNAASANKTK